MLNLTLSSRPIGILIELEYKPCVSPKLCWDVMSEFMGKFMVAPKTPHSHLQNSNLEIFTPRDTTQQYNDQFNNLRKTTVNAQANANSPSVGGVNPAKLGLNN